MKQIDTIRRAGRNLRHAKTRTLLTSIAIAVGAFTITLSLAAGAGGRQYASNLINANTDVHELRVTKQTAVLANSDTPQVYQPNQSSTTIARGVTVQELNDSDLATLRSASGVDSVDPVYTLDVQYVTRPGQKQYVASVDTYNKSVTLQYLAGSGAALNDNGIIITDGYRSALGFASSQAALGQTIDLVVQQAVTAVTPHPVTQVFPQTIVGVYQPSTLSFTSGSSLQVTSARAQQLYDFNTAGLPTHGLYMAAVVHANPSANTTTIKNAITAKGYRVQTAQDLMGTLFNFINVLQGILLGFGGLAVLTSVFGIINTQYISVLERTQQIGLMKALGMRRKDIGRLFRFEAAWIGFLGGVIGSGLALLAGLIADPHINKALSLQAGTNLLIFQPWMFIVVIGGLMIVAMAAGILPARKAAKLDPIEALRTE